MVSLVISGLLWRMSLKFTARLEKRSMEAAPYLTQHGTDVKNYSGLDDLTAKTSRKDNNLVVRAKIFGVAYLNHHWKIWAKS